MYAFVRPAYAALDTEEKKELCATSYRVCKEIFPWDSKSQVKIINLLSDLFSSFAFIRRDIEELYTELKSCKAESEVPYSVIESIRAYFQQFYQIKDKKLYLPTIAPKKKVATQEVKKVNRIPVEEEIWWVIRVKNTYRICQVMFDRGDSWEVAIYQNDELQNARYRIFKNDNRVIYVFKEHITPEEFDSKIAEAVRIRKAALEKQALHLIQSYRKVLIARHTTFGTIACGVVSEDPDFWYLEGYTESGEKVLSDDTLWKVDKKSHCTVLKIYRKK